MNIISAEKIKSLLDWEGVLDAMHTAHLGPRPEGSSFFLGDSSFGILGRGVILPGSGGGIKVASICPNNINSSPPRPVEDAAYIVVDEHTKSISAILDGPEITRWKTPADSVLAGRKLSRNDSSVLLVIGAGPVAKALVDAYLHIRPRIREILLWNRTREKLIKFQQSLVSRGVRAEIIEDLDTAVSRSDIIASATSSDTPLILGKHVKPGTHIDLLGGYRPDMQEADSTAVAKARIFVDDHSNAMVSGDIKIPLNEGFITDKQIEGDLYDLCQDTNFFRKKDDITVYKNAGGAHLDLIVSQYVISLLRETH